MYLLHTLKAHVPAVKSNARNTPMEAAFVPCTAATDDLLLYISGRAPPIPTSIDLDVPVEVPYVISGRPANLDDRQLATEDEAFNRCSGHPQIVRRRADREQAMRPDSVVSYAAGYPWTDCFCLRS